MKKREPEDEQLCIAVHPHTHSKFTPRGNSDKENNSNKHTALHNTINTIINGIIAITNINILDAKWLKIKISITILSSLSNVSCCLLEI